ncbi:MAG: hypothetical protein Q7R63_01910, partial [bacterium]|nr:hypothetical protein [bacterium]
MHKLVRIIAVGTIILFGAVFSAHAQSAAEAALAGAFPTLSAIKTVVGSGTGPLIDGIIAGAGGPLGAIAQSGIGSTFLGWIGLKGIGYVMFVLSYIAGFIGSVAFTLAGLLVEFGLLLNSTILDGEVVQLGWRFCRDLANLGFTIGIVVIAYATMLGYESYGLKKLIGNFVIAAVMVNFSFSIAGFAIDISNMLTHFFVKASIGGGAGQVGWESFHTFTETLASAFSPQKLLVTNTGNIQVYESISTNDGMIAAVLSIFFVSLFTAFCALGMLMVGLTTISRFAYLSGLIIIMPLAVLCYAFPKTKGYYHKWYGDFMCQLMYLPAATFSMYIIIMFVQVKANIGLGNSQAIDLNKLLSGFEAASAASGGLTARGTLDLMMAPFRTITDMVLVLTFLFYAITKSRNIGCAGGDIALKWANGLRGWAIGTVTGAPAWAGRKVLSGGIDEEGRNRGTRLGNILSNIPLVRRLVPRLNDFAAGTSKNIGNFETQNKKLGDVQLMTKMRSLEILTSAEDMAAAAKVAAERGLFSEDDPEKGLTQKEFDRFIPAVKRYGMEADILKKLPHLYSKFGLNVEKENGEYVNKEHGKKLDDAIKALKPEDVENLPVEAFADAEIVSRFTGAHLEKLPKDKKIRDMFAETFNGLAKPESMGAEKFRQFVAKTFAKPEADAALLPALLANPLVVKGLTNANLKKLAGADKTKHREAFLDTINDPSKFSDKELQDFMRENFANSKSIDEIHPDIIRNKRFFNGLDEKHIQRMNAEPEEKQQEAMLAGLRESYKDLNADVYATNATPDQETIAKLDRMAKVIVDKKKDWQWSPLVNNDATKEAFREIEEEYHKRNPDDNELKQRKERLTELERSKKKDDDDAYGPPAPPPPPAPTTPSPYPAGGGGPAGKPTPTPTAGTATANQPARKQLDIGEAMDAALKNTDLFPSEIETKDTF